MGIFNLILNQPRAVATPPATPAPGTPVTEIATAPAAPTPPPAAQTPPPAPQPAVPVRTPSIFSFAARLDSGVSFRDFDHPTGFAAAWMNRVSLGLQHQVSPGVSLVYHGTYTNEHFDIFNGRQQAGIDTFALGIRAAFRVTELLTTNVNFEFGGALLSAEATRDGSRGLLYGANFLHYSANNGAFSIGGDAGAALRVYNGTAARLYLNVNYGIRFSIWKLTPDALDRSETDQPVGVDSIAHQLSLGLTVALGSREQARLSDPAPVEPTTRPAARSTEVPAAPPAATPPAATPPAVAAAPVVTPASAPTTTPAANTDPRAPLAFTLTASAPLFRGINDNYAASIPVARVNSELLPNGHGARFRIIYTDRTHGRIELVSYSVRAASNRITTYPAGDSEIPIDPVTLRNLMQSIVQAGLPRHNATGGQGITLGVNRAATGNFYLNSY